MRNPIALASLLLALSATTASAQGYTLHVGNLTVTAANSVLTVTGTDASDHIYLYQDPQTGLVYLNNVTIGINPAQVIVSAMKGDDYIQADIHCKGLLMGGQGSDTIYSGFYMTEVHGNLGNDSMILRGGNDTCYGEAGSDSFTLGTYWKWWTTPIGYPGSSYVQSHYLFPVIGDFSHADGDTEADPNNVGWSQQTLH
ncbi:hypothetical protein [Singulisphaera sp. PoT]|uniref:hypothetical protein n=1 Tax=Singulisphaera sp. PoT TaxID=3411797 RepID=UPI003BF5526C